MTMAFPHFWKKSKLAICSSNKLPELEKLPTSGIIEYIPNTDLQTSIAPIESTSDKNNPSKINSDYVEKSDKDYMSIGINNEKQN